MLAGLRGPLGGWVGTGSEEEARGEPCNLGRWAGRAGVSDWSEAGVMSGPGEGSVGDQGQGSLGTGKRIVLQ